VPIVTLVILAIVVLVSIVALVVLRPHISGIAVPRVAPADAPITVAYRSSGWGSADYTVLAADGGSVRRGDLPMGAGAFVIVLPRSSSAQTYRLRLHAGNGVQNSESDAYIRVPPNAGAPVAHEAHGPGSAGPQTAVEPPEIRSLALDRATVADGETVGVYYDVAATSGSVSLFDPARQITYAKADLSPSGHTSFNVPHIDGGRVLTVILTAQRGTIVAQSRVGLNVVATATAPAAPARDADSEPTTRAAAGVAAALSAPRSVKARAPIHVEVRGASSELRVVMLDTSGNEFARRDVLAGQRGTNFVAPDVRTPTRFTFQATFLEGQGTETVVREIAVTP
jgi:hypothetical protein